MQDKFEQSELNGRNKFELFCNTQQWCKINRWSPKKFDSWDVSIFSADSMGRIVNIIVEVKDREKYNSTDFGNWYLEETKYNGLEAEKKKVKDKYIFSKKQFNIGYWNCFNDGMYKMWIVDNVDERKETVIVKLPKTSKGGNTEFVETPVYLMNNMEVIIKGKL